MKLPKKVLDTVLAEAKKEARFSWYSGWERTSGYIKSELRGDRPYGTTRIYIKWEKKKEPTKEQVDSEIEKYIDSLLKNEQHHHDQKEFRYYLLSTYYVDVNRLKHEAMLSLIDCLPKVIEAIEKSDNFTEPYFQNLHNDLKNLECGINDHEAIEKFLDVGRKRIGES